MVLSIFFVVNVKEIWDNFELVYRLYDIMIKMQVNTKFYLLKMKEYESVDQFVVSFRAVRLKLF